MCYLVGLSHQILNFGDENISDEDMYKAAEIAQALEFYRRKRR